MTCGKKSFISEALEIAGGQNIFGDAKINYSNISLESIIRRNPDVIIEINALPGFDENMKSRMLYRWKMFSGINAVKNSKIFFIKGQRALIPGPGIVELIYKFKKMLGKTHPGDAGE
jgi:iron complex transport system substrate-binding protein